MSLCSNPPKALLFDVFGTCTNWRDSVIRHLEQRAKASDPKIASSLPTSTWADLADDWRAAYYKFTRAFEPGKTEWRDIDSFHHEALIDLLPRYGLRNVWTAEEVKDISFIWHKLDGWSDAGDGIRKLNALGLQTASLSNGNISLLTDLANFADLPFTRVLSAEQARTGDAHHCYKPNRAVYEYGARALGVEVGDCALVAAHLGDLKAAKGVGMRAIYVERGDETWKIEQVAEAKQEGWVDLWVNWTGEGQGFLEVAERLTQWR